MELPWIIDRIGMFCVFFFSPFINLQMADTDKLGLQLECPFG